MVALWQPDADGPGNEIGVQAALGFESPGTITGNKHIGLFSSAVGVVEPGISHDYPAKLSNWFAVFSASSRLLNVRDNIQRQSTSSAAL